MNSSTDHLPTPELNVYARLDVEITEGDGVRVKTAAGDWLLDFYGGHAVAALGYRHPGLLAALQTQAEQLFFQTNLVELDVRRRAAASLVALAPEGLGRVFLVNSGAEANENALRIALRSTGRNRVVALEGGFHGRTAAAGACTHGALKKWYGFPRTPFDVTFVAPEDRKALAAAVDSHTAALIVEPVQGIAGAVALSADYLRECRKVTRTAGALLIADEVQCGMGRCGTAFAVEDAGVVPDLLTTAKGLAGGFPAGAVLLKDELGFGLGSGDLGTTFGGGPMACALIEAVARELVRPGFLEQVRRVGDLIAERCAVGPVTAVQGRGLLRGLCTRPPAAEVIRGLRQRGILAGSATHPHVVRLLPPLVIEEEHVEELRTALQAL